MVDIVTGELHPGPIRHRFPYQDQKRLLNEARSNFVVALFTGRTGSTFVQNSLNRHPDIEFKGEFLAKVVKDENAAVLQEQLIGRFFARRDKKIHVFKTKIQDIKNLEVLRQNILSHDCIVIHSYRTNVVKQCISGMRPRKLLEETETNFGLRLPRNLIAKSVASGIRPLGKMVIEKRRLDGALSYFSQNAKTLCEFLESLRDVHVIEMAYEDLNDHEALVLNSLIAYMGLRPIEWEETILKHTSDSLRDVIENFDELAEMYRGTPYYEMFFDGDVARPKMVEPTQSEPVSIAPNVPSIAPEIQHRTR